MKLFGKKTVDGVVGKLNAMLADLDAVAGEQLDRAVQASERVAQAQAEEDAACAEHTRALKVKANLQALVGA